MRILAASIALALAASAGAATAQERVSDSHYLQMARCVGLVQGSNAQAEDLEAALRSNRRGRSDHIRDRANHARQQAASEIRAASGGSLAELTAERDGACQQLVD